MKKVLIIITLSEFGGAQKHVAQILEYGEHKKYQYALVYGGNGEAFKNFKTKKYQIKELARSICPRKDFIAYKRIKDAINDFQPDVVHCHSSKAGILGRLAAKNARVDKIIYTAHGFVFKEPLNILKRSLYYYIEKIFARYYTDKLICVSENDKKYAILKKFKKSKELFYIPNGIDFNKFKRKQVSSRKMQKGVCVANFYKTKGHRYLLEALKDKNISIDLVGIDGGTKKELVKIIKKNKIDKRVKFLGFKKDISKLLIKYDFFVLPSVKEGFPYVVLEALATDLPIVATKVGGIPKVIKNNKNGLLVEPKDSNALGIALTKLVSGKYKYQSLYFEVKKQYDVRNIIKKIELLY